MTVRKISRYGWRRDLPDPRDRIYNLENPIRRAHQLPSRCDLESEMPAVYDQGQLGSCTANAACALLEHQEMRQNEGVIVPSRLFVYYQSRVLDGSPVGEDTGSEVRTAIKVLVNDGAPPETDWPYSDQQPGPFQQKPPDTAFADAVKHEATVYKRIVIGPGAPMRTAIAAHQPIAFGFSVPDTFESDRWDPSTQPLPLPTAADQFIGGHAVVIVGYDWSRTRFAHPAFKVRNSWGAGWGKRGYFWMDSRWFDTWRGLCDDLWIVETVT